MRSDVNYEDEAPRHRRHRLDDEKEYDFGDHSRMSKRRRHSPDSFDEHSRGYRSRDNSDDRHRRRNRSRSPRPQESRSHDRISRHDQTARRSRSRSPLARSDRDRRARRGGTDHDGGVQDSRQSRRRRRSSSAGGRDKYEERDRRRRQSSDAINAQEPAQNSLASRRSGPLPSQADSFAVSNGEEPEKPKEKPNFGNTGHLAAASNSVAQADGTVITLKYHEPPEARKPSPRDQWKLFVFKGKDIVDTIDLSARSCWLVGRESAVVDLPAENPSISKQHAVIQFRYTEKRNEFGDKIGRVKPYVIDLQSANGTHLNGQQVADRRYLELRPKDVLKFGTSDREYVVMLSRD